MVVRAEVERHLEELLASPQFHRAPKHAAFLRHVTLAALDGRLDSAKEVIIASEVYGRTDYDPTIDSLIRVEASRLRKRLGDYYAQSPSITRIALPKGAYIPVFEHGSGPSPRAISWRFALAFLAFAALAGGVLGWNFYRQVQIRALLAEAASAFPSGKDFVEASQSERGAKGLPELMGAAALYQRVLAIDSRNVAALEGLSKTYYRALDYDPALSLKMAAAARRLRQLQPNSSEAQFYLGYHAHFFEKNYALSSRHFQAVRAAKPDDEGIYRYIFLASAASGEPAAALPIVEDGRKRLPQSAIVALTHVALLTMLHRFADAERETALIVAAHPRIPAAYSRRGWALYFLGRPAEAESQFKRCLEISPGEPSCTANLAYLYRRTRRPQLAAPFETRLARLPDRSRHLLLAVASMGFPDHAAALHHLELASKAGDPALPYARPGPIFASLHGDPRFERLFP